MPSHSGSNGHSKASRDLEIWGRRIERVMRRAVLKAAIDHKQRGLSMIICRNGKPVEVSADVVIRANRPRTRRRSPR